VTVSYGTQDSVVDHVVSTNSRYGRFTWVSTNNGQLAEPSGRRVPSRKRVQSIEAMPVSASICLLTSVMMSDGSVVISASILDSMSERV
jgi:hypothetical protein